MSYQGDVTLISGLKQANNQNFALIHAKDVYVDDNTRLDGVLETLISQGGNEPSFSPIDFSYNNNNLNIITSENSDTNFSYDNGNLIINYQ